MKTYQQYDFQRKSAHLRDDQPFSNTNCPNINNSPCDVRISLLEQRIDGLEKKLLFYEELISVKTNEFDKSQQHSNLINDTLRRIAEFEESLAQLNSKANYSLQAIDIESIIEGKLTINKILIDTQLNDLSIMMQDLSQYDVDQQKQYSNTQDVLKLFSNRIDANSLKIKELNKHIKLLQNMINESNSEDEELFFKNIQRK